MSDRNFCLGVLCAFAAACLPAAAQTRQDSLNLERARTATREVELLLSAPIDTGTVHWPTAATAIVTSGGSTRIQRLWCTPETDWVVWSGDTATSAPHFLLRRDGSAAYSLNSNRTAASAVAPELGKALGLLRPMGPLPTGRRRSENRFRRERGVQDTLVAVAASGLVGRAVFGEKDAVAADITGSWVRIVGPRGWDAFTYPAERPLHYLEITDAGGKLIFRFSAFSIDVHPLDLDLGTLRAPVHGRTLIDVARERATQNQEPEPR